MGTITPILSDTVVKGSANAGSGLLKHMHTEQICIYVGHYRNDEPQEQFKNIIVQDVAQAQEVILEVINVFRKIPAVIIYKFRSGYEQDMKRWERFFDVNSLLRSIPFFVLSEEVSDELKGYVRKCTFIDEVISHSCLEESLSEKIEFVSKFKRLQSFTPKEKINVRKIEYTLGTRFNHMSKRAFDILVAGIAILLLSPVFIVLALLVKFTSKGPIFYAASRAGKNYHIFKFYKFRTMVTDADKQLAKLQHLNQYAGNTVFYKVSNDPRITPLGNFLRNSSLDELPQLFNVLIGDMSLVGNRPLPLYEASALTTDEWTQRFLAPAGITGLWQVSKRGKKEMSTEERINLDINYAEKFSFTTDIWIMVNTPLALVQKDNV